MRVTTTLLNGETLVADVPGADVAPPTRCSAIAPPNNKRTRRSRICASRRPNGGLFFSCNVKLKTVGLSHPNGLTPIPRTPLCSP